MKCIRSRTPTSSGKKQTPDACKNGVMVVEQRRPMLVSLSNSTAKQRVSGRLTVANSSHVGQDQEIRPRWPRDNNVL